MVGDRLTIFPTRWQANEFSSQHDQGEVVEVDVITNPEHTQQVGRARDCGRSSSA